MGNSVQGFEDFESTLKLFQITSNEVKIVQEFQPEAELNLKEFIDYFYKWLPHVPEYKDLFSRAGLVAKVKELQVNYWKQFFLCRIDLDYLESRYKVGSVHARINLPISSYVAGVNTSSDWWFRKINQIKGEKATTIIAAMNKFFLFDMAIITAAYSQATNDLIEQQSRALMEMSTPTIELWDDVLVLPILGVLDSKRAEDMTDIMLNKILNTGARYIIIDIQGVPTVDSSVANHLIKITKATKLMGCECILSGISPDIAQTLVQLGIELETIETTANLKSAFKTTLFKAGFRVKQEKD